MQMTHSGKVLVIDNDPERAAALAEASYPGFAVTWSNEGY